MEDIQSWWELPSIAHFCSLFRAAFDLLDFDIEELEEAILTDGLDRSGSPLLVELLVRLLHGCLPGRNITACNFDSYLRKLFKQKCQDDQTKENLFPDGVYFRHLSLRRKVEVLHALCDFRLEADDVLELLKNLETESLRVEPLGYDDSGSTYWYFYGTRLYREDNSLYHPFRRRPREKEKDKEDKRKKKRKKKDSSGDEEDSLPAPLWQVQCYTEEDWCKLSKKFEDCESKLEKSLLQTLKDDFLPEIPRLFEEKEKIQQKRMMEFAPRRSSCRVQKLREKKEEEGKKLAEELAIQEKRRKEEEEKRRSLEDEDEEERMQLQVEQMKIEEEVLITEEAHTIEEATEETEEKSIDRNKKKRLSVSSDLQLSNRHKEREDEVLQERNMSYEPILKEEESEKFKNSRRKKSQHRKQHKRSNHKTNPRSKIEALSPDNRTISDTSNKENTFLSECEEHFDIVEEEDDSRLETQVYSGRKTNNSLSSLAFSLTPSIVVPEPTKPIGSSPLTKKRVKNAHMLLQTEDDLRTGMYKVLEHLREHEDAWPFLDPVEETFAPNYYAVIRRPMYITKMESRLDAGSYGSLTNFEADFKLMMDNCKLYNGPDSEYTHMAYTLEKVFAKLKAKYLETEFSSDEEIYIDLSFHEASKRRNRKRSSADEKENKMEEENKRGKRKKVGRKPKIAPEGEMKKTKAGRSKSKDGEIFNGDANEEDEEVDYNESLLLVREDPYPEVDNHQGLPSTGISGSTMLGRSATDVEGVVDGGYNVVNKWKKGPDKTIEKEFPTPLKRGAGSSKKAPKKVKDITPKGRSAKNGESTTECISDSDSDCDSDGVLLYYNHNEENSNSEDEKRKTDKNYISERHNELFGPVDDFGLEGKGLEKRLKKTSILKDKKKHKHHHHHHHNHHAHHKLKELKHHHHKRKPKHVGDSPSPSKKVLQVEEVYAYSEDDPNSKEAKSVKKQLPALPTVSQSVKAESAPSPKEKEKESALLHKKKNRHKGKHSKRIKHKEGKDKIKTLKKGSKRKTTKSKKMNIPVKKMAAIDALSAATEQTLKDITTLLDDPEVPRFTAESPHNSVSPSHRVTSQEFESIALKIEADYRRKLKLTSGEEAKYRKKKRKLGDRENENGVKKKKMKKEKHKENDKEKERKNSDTGSLDNIKELFKDIKDGRIKPGAIIKSKDIAKKEGVVKKESKPPSEPKVKNKQNPFGKINKQENSKLTTLIAKAKESRIGLVPNSEVGDSPKLSLGSIIVSGDIGSKKQSSRDSNSPEDDDKMSEKLSEKFEKWDSPWEKPSDPKDEVSNPPSQHTEEEEEKDEVEELKEASPESPTEELLPPPLTPRAPEFKQEKATPNLSAWFRAFGGPSKLNPSTSKKRMDGDDGEDFEDGEDMPERKMEEEAIDVEEEKDEAGRRKDEEGEEEEPKVISPDLSQEGRVPTPRPGSNGRVPTPRPGSNGSPSAALSPQPPPLSQEKPPETPWYDKLTDKEEEPIWKNNKIDEEEDPYKFEEEELDRAREEAKKLEVERQRKVSVSSSGLSDPSPLNIDSDRSPAAFSSEGERSPATTRSPLTPGFGGVKQFSPVTEKSPTVAGYSPRYDTGISKNYPGFDDKGKYQSNGSLKVGFYQDMNDKSNQDKVDTPKSLEQKLKESPIYSPTVPYVSPLYSSKDQSMCKQKSPGRYSSYYSSIDSSLDKPKTPGYYSTSAPSTPSDRPSPAGSLPTSDDKSKAPQQYNYYNYDPTKSLTDQYKNTGSSSVVKSFYSDGGKSSTADHSPLNTNTPLSTGLNSPSHMPLHAKSSSVEEKSDVHLKKKQSSEKHSSVSEPSQNCAGSLWGEKRDEVVRERSITSLRNQFPTHPLPADLANLSQIVSRIPNPDLEGKECEKLGTESLQIHALLGKTVHASQLLDSSVPSSIADLHQMSSRVSDNSSLAECLHKSSHLQPPPVAHQKAVDSERPGSRNMPPPPHASEKSRGFLHQKTMWSSNLPSSIPSSLSNLVSNATMASIALAGQKGLGSFPPEHLPQFGMDRAALASLAAGRPQAGGQLFPHDLIQRNASSQGHVSPSPMVSPPGLSLQSHLNGTGSTNGPSPGSSHSRSSASGGSSSGGSSSSGPAAGGSTSNFDLGLARSYASIMSGNQTSPLFVRSEASLTGAGGSLPHSISGSSSPFLSQSPGLSAALGMAGSSRTPTPAHQQSLSQNNFPSVPRDPISQSHPSLQIPSLNSITCSQAQTLSHLNAVSLASYSSRDSLALMNQGGRGPLVGVEPTTQQLYQQYLQRHQLAAQEELLFRSAGAHSQFAHQSMMIQQGLMSAAAASYNSGYPHSLGLRSGTYQGMNMNRPWI